MSAATTVSNPIWNKLSGFVKENSKTSILVTAVLITIIAIPLFIGLGIHLAPAIIGAGVIGLITGISGLTYDTIKRSIKTAIEKKKSKEETFKQAQLAYKASLTAFNKIIFKKVKKGIVKYLGDLLTKNYSTINAKDETVKKLKNDFGLEFINIQALLSQELIRAQLKDLNALMYFVDTELAAPLNTSHDSIDSIEKDQKDLETTIQKLEEHKQNFTTIYGDIKDSPESLLRCILKPIPVPQSKPKLSAKTPPNVPTVAQIAALATDATLNSPKIQQLLRFEGSVIRIGKGRKNQFGF